MRMHARVTVAPAVLMLSACSGANHAGPDVTFGPDPYAALGDAVEPPTPDAATDGGAIGADHGSSAADLGRSATDSGFESSPLFFDESTGHPSTPRGGRSTGRGTERMKSSVTRWTPRTSGSKTATCS